MTVHRTAQTHGPTWRKCGQVRKAKDPAPASRRPASRPETLGDHHPSSTETITQESGLRENRTSRLSERTEEGRQPDLLRLYRVCRTVTGLRAPRRRRTAKKISILRLTSWKSDPTR